MHNYRELLGDLPQDTRILWYDISINSEGNRFICYVYQRANGRYIIRGWQGYEPEHWPDAGCDSLEAVLTWLVRYSLFEDNDGAKIARKIQELCPGTMTLEDALEQANGDPTLIERITKLKIYDN